MTASNILSVLRAEHHYIIKLFETLGRTTPRSSLRRLKAYAEIHASLTRHIEFEEAHVYPLLAVRKNSKQLSLEAIEVHAQMKRLLSEMRKMNSQDERWLAKSKVLMEDVRHHAKEEESEMFGLLCKAVNSKQLKSMAIVYELFRSSAALKALDALEKVVATYDLLPSEETEEMDK